MDVQFGTVFRIAVPTISLGDTSPISEKGRAAPEMADIRPLVQTTAALRGTRYRIAQEWKSNPLATPGTAIMSMLCTLR